MKTYTITKYGRFWAVRDTEDELVCVCVYKRGAVEVIRRLQTTAAAALELHESQSGETGAKISMDSLGQPTPLHRTEPHDRCERTTKPTTE